MKKDASSAHIQAISRKLMQQLGLLADQVSLVGSVSQYHALLELSTHKLMSGLQLAQTLNLEQSTTSRLITQLVAKELCTIKTSVHDKRMKLISLTPKGVHLTKKIDEESQGKIQQALEHANQQEKELIAQGLSLFTNILQQFQLKNEYIIRKFSRKDIEQVKHVIQRATIENGLNGDYPAPTYNASILEDIRATLTTPRSCHFVVEHTEILGGAGYRPISEEDPHTCIIQGLYLAPHIRKLGIGHYLMEKVFEQAKKDGFTRCYAEDYNSGEGTKKFLTTLGFQPSKKPAIRLNYTEPKYWYVKEL